MVVLEVDVRVAQSEPEDSADDVVVPSHEEADKQALMRTPRQP